MSFETAPVGLAVSIAPPRMPISIAASASTSHRVRKGSLLIDSVRSSYGNCGQPAERQSRPQFRIAVCPSKSLMPGYEMGAPILLPAGLIVFSAERPLFPPAHRIHTVGGDAERNKVILGGLSSAFTEADVVFSGTALVALAFDGDADLRVRAQKFGGLRQIISGVRANIRLVEVEVRVLYILLEQLAQVPISRGRSFYGSRSYGDACVRCCGAAWSRGSDCKSCRLRRVHRRGALRHHLAYARLNIEIRGAGGGPTQRDGIATFN